jgi:hypothetical protein
VINATAAGARIPGFEHAPLGEVIKDLPPLGLGVNSLCAALEGLPRPSRDSLGHRLALTRAELKRGLHLLAEQGMGAGMAGLDAKSVTRQVLRGLPPNGTPDQAKELLEETLKTLNAMEAGLDD